MRISSMILLAIFSFVGGFWYTGHRSGQEMSRAPAADSRAIREDYLSEPVAKNLSERREQVCNRLIPYESAGTLKDDELNYLPHLCTPLFRASQPKMPPNIGLYVQKQKQVAFNTMVGAGRPPVHDSGLSIPEFEAFLQQRRLKRITTKTREALLSRARELREEVIPKCCGGDHTCIETMQQTNFQVCDSKPVGDRVRPNPSCVTANGFAYSPSPDHLFAFLARYADGEGRNPAFHAEFAKIAKITPAQFLTAKSVRKIRTNKPSPIHIMLSEYERNSEKLSSEATIIHELGHACTSARLQSQLYRGGSIGRQELALLLLRRTVGSCAATKKQIESYAKAAGNIVQPAVARCLAQAAFDAGDSRTEAHSPKACPMKHMEEGIAQSLAIQMTDGPAQIARGCSTTYDEDHPKNPILLKCLLARDPKFRSQMMAEFGCYKKARARTRPSSGAQ